jgi:tetratricopeptide (TPR) repeat protein
MEQNRQLFHLLAVCPQCREVGGWLLELHQANALPPLFGPIDAALARSRAEAPGLLQELLPLDPEERLARIHADQRFVSWGLCELLVRKSCETAAEQASQAIHLADLAVHLADRISEADLFEEHWVYQLRSLAWASLGNGCKVQGDLPGAERCIDMADNWWEAGTQGSEDALGYEPILLYLKAPLRTAQRRFAEALKLLDEAAELFLHGEYPDPHLAGRSFVKKSVAYIDMGDTVSAIEALKKANGLIDPEREPRLLLCVRHNLADTLSKAGQHREAAALLPALKELAATHGRAKDRLRLEWIEGRVAAGLGDHEQARQLLTKVRQTFLAEGNAFDAALAALLLFQEAARQETATADLAREVAASLTRSRPQGVTS